MRCAILTTCIGSMLHVRHPHGSVYKHAGSGACSTGYRLLHLYDGACWSHFNDDRIIPGCVFYRKQYCEFCPIECVDTVSCVLFSIVKLRHSFRVCVCFVEDPYILLAFYKTKWHLQLKQALCKGGKILLLIKESNSNSGWEISQVDWNVFFFKKAI